MVIRDKPGRDSASQLYLQRMIVSNFKDRRDDGINFPFQCIYGSYVHSAILPTFHRRCYWLLQNPDIVLVHYLNVPFTNNAKLSIPVVSFANEKKEWTKEELVEQLRPMCKSVRKITGIFSPNFEEVGGAYCFWFICPCIQVGIYVAAEYGQF